MWHTRPTGGLPTSATPSHWTDEVFEATAHAKHNFLSESWSFACAASSQHGSARVIRSSRCPLARRPVPSPPGPQHIGSRHQGGGCRRCRSDAAPLRAAAGKDCGHGGRERHGCLPGDRAAGVRPSVCTPPARSLVTNYLICSVWLSLCHVSRTSHVSGAKCCVPSRA